MPESSSLGWTKAIPAHVPNSEVDLYGSDGQGEGIKGLFKII